MYADLLRFYGVDLLETVAEEPTLSPARALALIQCLPEDAASSAYMRGAKDAAGWGKSDYLLATLIDAVHENTFATIQLKSKKKLKPPERLPVPGIEKKKQRNNFVAAAQKFLMSQQEA